MRRPKRSEGTAATDQLGVPGFVDVLPIATGGAGAVYRARQVAFDRIVAVKVLAAPVTDAAARARFEREQQLTGRLTGHPAIARVYDAGFTSSSQPYLVMEYYGRGTLRELVARQGSQDLQTLCDVGIKVAGALATAHANGILHRDVKPANILLDDFGGPVLADFGIAGMSSDAELLTHAFTTEFAAPEILARVPVYSEAADQFSLALTLSTLLPAAPPLGDLDAVRVHVIAAAGPAISAALVRALDEVPSQRFASVTDFAYALQAAQRGSGLAVTELKVAPVATPDDGNTRVATNTGRTLPAAPLTSTPETRLSGAGDKDSRRPKRRTLVLAVGALLGVAIIAGAATAVLGGGEAPAAKSPSAATTSAASPTTNAAAAGLQAPIGLRIASDSGTRVTLIWDDTNGGEAGYLVAATSTGTDSVPVRTGNGATGTEVEVPAGVPATFSVLAATFDATGAPTDTSRNAATVCRANGCAL